MPRRRCSPHEIFEGSSVEHGFALVGRASNYVHCSKGASLARTSLVSVRVPCNVAQAYVRFTKWVYLIPCAVEVLGAATCGPLTYSPKHHIACVRYDVVDWLSKHCSLAAQTVRVETYSHDSSLLIEAFAECP